MNDCPFIVEMQRRLLFPVRPVSPLPEGGRRGQALHNRVHRQGGAQLFTPWQNDIPCNLNWHVASVTNQVLIYVGSCRKYFEVCREILKNRNSSNFLLKRLVSNLLENVIILHVAVPYLDFLKLFDDYRYFLYKYVGGSRSEFLILPVNQFCGH